MRIDENYAYPHIVAGTKMIIVREDGDYIWLRGAPPEDPNSPLHKIWAKREARQAVSRTLAEMAGKPGAKYYLNFSAEAVPPPFMESLTFVPVTQNLPTEGRWQMGFAAADMNEDGNVDLVFPPRRKGYPVKPIIYLGDGKGGFKLWAQQKWPDNVSWDYGDVEVADFDGDGHQDARPHPAAHPVDKSDQGRDEPAWPPGCRRPEPAIDRFTETVCHFAQRRSVVLGNKALHRLVRQIGIVKQLMDLELPRIQFPAPGHDQGRVQGPGVRDFPAFDFEDHVPLPESVPVGR